MKKLILILQRLSTPSHLILWGISLAISYIVMSNGLFGAQYFLSTYTLPMIDISRWIDANEVVAFFSTIGTSGLHHYILLSSIDFVFIFCLFMFTSLASGILLGRIGRPRLLSYFVALSLARGILDIIENVSFIASGLLYSSEIFPHIAAVFSTSKWIATILLFVSLAILIVAVLFVRINNKKMSPDS